MIWPFTLIRDARRYRWLREQHWIRGQICVVEARDVKMGGCTYSLERLDKVCDESRRRKLPSSDSCYL